MQEDMIKECMDLRHLNWSQTRHSSGTAGSFLKSYDEYNGKKRYYKLSDFDAWHGIIGHECVNELIADRLLTVLDIPHLHYQLIAAQVLIGGKEYRTWLCRSDDFKRFGERKLALDTYYQLECMNGETPLEFCVRNGWQFYIDQMLLIDYLILNRDRHGANIEILQSWAEKTYRPAPLFDHGLSLLFSCHDLKSGSFHRRRHSSCRQVNNNCHDYRGCQVSYAISDKTGNFDLSVQIIVLQDR